MSKETVEAWHNLIRTKNVGGLDDVLADNVVFHSPVVHTPQEGKKITKLYLMAAFQVLAGDKFRYVREVIAGDNAMLEFVTEIDGIHINGVDMMHFNDAGQIDNFKVMVRPLKAINMLHGMMKRMLEQMQS